ncbi:MAG: response regulator [Actinomycetota bacterium]
MATILIIDDEDVIGLIIRHHLEPDGHEVLLATDGPSGIALAERERPDAIVLDLMMPEMDGHEVLDHLKADIRTREIPVVVLTVMRSFHRDARCIEQGAAKVVGKPFDPGELTIDLLELATGDA